MNTKINVYVRHIHSNSACHLVSVASFSDLEPLMEHICATGIYCEESGQVENKAKLQYVLDEEDAYAEIIVGSED